MIRFMHAEIYKLRKSKSFYIFLIITVAFVALMYGTIGMMGSTIRGKADDSMTAMIQNNMQATDGSIWDRFQVMDYMRQIFSGDMIACVIGIFTSIFVIREYGSGMMKNIVGKGSSRGSIYLSKLLTTVFASLLFSLTGVVAVLAIGRIFIGANAFAGDFWKNLIVYVTLQLIMTCTLTAIFVMIGELCRNLAAAISISIGIAALPTMILHVIDMQFADQGITLSQYWPVSRMAGCPFQGFTAGYVTETLVTAALWLGLATGVGMWHFYRTDIS